jgi:hypothetical protein
MYYGGGGKLQRPLTAATAVVVFAVLLTESEIVVKPGVMSAVLYLSNAKSLITSDPYKPSRSKICRDFQAMNLHLGIVAPESRGLSLFHSINH